MEHFLASEKVFALMHLDLDRFKLINDTFSHAAGDHVLQQAARIMLAQTRKEDAVLRIGGDEFILIFPGVTDLETLDVMAYRLTLALENRSRAMAACVKFLAQSVSRWPQIMPNRQPRNFWQIPIRRFMPLKMPVGPSICSFPNYSSRRFKLRVFVVRHGVSVLG